MIVFHFLDLKFLAKFNRNVLSQINQFYNPKLLFFSISLLENDENFPGINKTAGFHERIISFMHCYLIYFFSRSLKESCSNQVFFLFSFQNCGYEY
jgi:hypothetical protein